MSNIYFKVTIEKREKMTFSKLGLSKFKKFVSMSVFGEFQRTQMLLNFKTSCSNLKSDPHLPKKNCVICFIESALKVMKNVFLFHLKSSFRSQDIYVFVMTFSSCRKNGLIRQ